MRETRYYKGKRKCEIITPVSPLKTVLVQWVDTGEKDIVPVRMCWLKPEGENWWGIRHKKAGIIQ